VSALRAWALTALASLSVAATALAADPKPDFAVNTKAIEASIFLDASIKADPALAANCLAEGKKWAKIHRAEAGKERRQTPELFRQGGWTYERKYQTRSLVGGRYVSIVRNDFIGTGGAHPDSNVNTILWDKTASKRISIQPFFTETADGGPALKAMASAIAASLKAQKQARGVEPVPEADGTFGIQPKLLKIGAVTLAPSTEAGKSSGLTFHYSPYTVGAYVEGGYVAFVPWETLKPYLTPEGAAIFGGARPKGDDEDRQ
jgi:uncharacterized protein YndB with AHSA1/START domain